MGSWLTSRKYDNCRNWIRERMDEGLSLEQIRSGAQDDRQALPAFLHSMKQYAFWPEELDEKRWIELADTLYEERQREIRIDTMSIAAIIADEMQTNSFAVSSDKRSAWMTYRIHLLEDAGFTQEAVRSIETACRRTMRVMSLKTDPAEPRRGLIVGSVQSGKTANMAGLMAMAADAGFNVFIILSGTIENLRMQTQERIYNDLNSQKRKSNFFWQNLDHPVKGAPPGARTRDMSLHADSRARYMTVCLKHVTRLNDLISWLWEDEHQLARMRILLIDDEADQAGIDTANIGKGEDRTAINRLIINLVYGPEHIGKPGAYGAMNYVSYTATPYANCLNEAGPGTLYPQNFIQTLATSLSYFGPDKFFPTSYSDVDGTLDMYREISAEDNQIIQALQKGETGNIPTSLQHALLWFFCVCAIMRFYKYRRPVSMLIHTSQNVNHHDAVAAAVRHWITSSRSHILAWCRELYAVEKLRVTHESLRAVYPDYEHPDAEIWDYPEFEDIAPYIETLTAEITTIFMDGKTGTLRYGHAVHLCVDNCTQNGTDENGTHMRLAYPSAEQLTGMDYAPAFIVIGGNTLSRGLTLQGLVCSYFLRTVRQADTLMQMGRWFGYRRHYELLPRVWMTQDTYDKFSLLASVDYDLRLQIRQMQELGQSPSEYAPKIITSPLVTWLRLTSPAKMQGAEVADVDFAGTQTQLTVYDTADDVLQGNLHCTEDFLKSLGKPQKSEFTAAYYWTEIPYNTINAGLFDSSFRIAETSKVFQQLEFLNEWVMEQTQKGEMTHWTVIACGREYVENETPAERIWSLPGNNRLGTVIRTARSATDSSVNIGVLADPRDFLADITPQMVSDVQWSEMRKTSSGQLDCDYFRRAAGVEKKPLLLLYRIYRKSEKQRASSRINLDLSNDLIGIAMLCPGIRSRAGNQQRLQLGKHFLDVEWEVE